MSHERLPWVFLAVCRQKGGPTGRSPRRSAPGWVPGRVRREGVAGARGGSEQSVRRVAATLRGKRRVWWRAARKASLATAGMAFSYDINFF